MSETETVRFQPRSRIASIYRCEEASEAYRCSYGMNPDFAATLLAGPLRAGAHDATGAVRSIELEGHPFFVATLFQPERAALDGRLPPLVSAFVQASAEHATQQRHAADGASLRG